MSIVPLRDFFKNLSTIRRFFPKAALRLTESPKRVRIELPTAGIKRHKRYECIDNAYHPNPGTAATGYDETERTVDWLYAFGFKEVRPLLDKWVAISAARVLEDDPSLSLKETLAEVMYADLYDPCAPTKRAVRKAYDAWKATRERPSFSQADLMKVCGEIATFLNESFLRVRLHGKYNPRGEDTVYFRISSHGFDWRAVVEAFLREVFGSAENMPKTVWIGHDAETNPPETVLFEGPPENLPGKPDEKWL